MRQDIIPQPQGLLEAVAAGCERSIAEAHKKGEDVNYAWAGGVTLLHIAASRSNAAVAHALIERGAAVNRTTRQGETPAYFAASEGNRDVLRVLARAGANLSVRTVHGITPLHVAFAKKDFETASLLLWLGADPTVRNSHQLTADQTVHPHLIPPELMALLRAAAGRRRAAESTREKQ